MDVSKIKQAINLHIASVENIVTNFVKQDGDKCSESQRICLLNATNNLQQVVNGLEQNDLI